MGRRSSTTRRRHVGGGGLHALRLYLGRFEGHLNVANKGVDKHRLIAAFIFELVAVILKASHECADKILGLAPSVNIDAVEPRFLRC